MYHIINWIKLYQERKMKNTFKKLTIAAIVLGFAVIPADARQFGGGNCDGQGSNFIDLDGDGYNDNAPDADGDGIPNGMDEDWIRPQDGSGQGNGNGQGNGSGDCPGDGSGNGQGQGGGNFVDENGDGVCDNFGSGSAGSSNGLIGRKFGKR
jgi:hypothetical protein